jgi:hypothetical protein
LAAVYGLVAAKSRIWTAGTSFIACSGSVSRHSFAEAISAASGAKVEVLSLENAQQRFGHAASDAMHKDNRSSGTKARQLLGWHPTGPSLEDDVKSGSYAAAAKL